MNENPEYMELLRQKEKSLRIARTCHLFWLPLLLCAAAETLIRGISVSGFLFLCGSVFLVANALFAEADATRRMFAIELLKLRLPNSYLGPARIDSAETLFGYWFDRISAKRRRKMAIKVLLKAIQSHRALGYDTTAQEKQLQILQDGPD